MIDFFWMVMTPLAPLGYQCIKKGRLSLGAVLLVTYGLCNMLTLGHYNFAPFGSISAKIHVFIMIEALLGGMLIVYVQIPYLQLITRRN